MESETLAPKRRAQKQTLPSHSFLDGAIYLYQRGGAKKGKWSILEVQTEEYWTDINPWMLETLRRRLRNLIKLIEGDAKQIVYTDFTDEIGDGTKVALPDAGVGTDKARFQLKVRHFLQAHSDHITILKLRRNEQLSGEAPISIETEIEKLFALEDPLQKKIRQQNAEIAYLTEVVSDYRNRIQILENDLSDCRMKIEQLLG